MLLLEHEGKDLFRESGIPVPAGRVLCKGDVYEAAVAAVPLPAVVKAQVPEGGRGKAGGILKAASASELQYAVATLSASEIKGYAVRQMLVEELKPVRREYYMAMLFDGEDQTLLVGAQGGIGVESFYGEGQTSFASVVIDPVYGLPEYRLRDALADLSIPRPLRGRFIDVAGRLTRLFRTYDATLAEINPLAELDDGTLMALDARVVIDDGALFRQPRFAERKAMEAGDDVMSRQMTALAIQWVPLGGPVGLIGSGAGCGVAIMDWVAHEGSRLAGFLDLDYAVLGGKTEPALRLVLDYYERDTSVRAILVNFTACGVRVDLIAESLAKILLEKRQAARKPIFVHFQGNRSAKAREVMTSAGYPPFDRLGDAVRAATAAARTG
jgi:succinyl-CoA synthetase beta subunit